MKFSLMILLFCHAIITFGQDNNVYDSTIITQHSENYLEIQSLRKVLHKTIPYPDSLLKRTNHRSNACVILERLIPLPPTLKNGVVIIKDRNDYPLSIHYYSDSTVLKYDFFDGRQLKVSEFYNPTDSTYYEVHFDEGMMQKVRVIKNNKIQNFNSSNQAE